MVYGVDLCEQALRTRDAAGADRFLRAVHADPLGPRAHVDERAVLRGLVRWGSDLDPDIYQAALSFLERRGTADRVRRGAGCPAAAPRVSVDA